MLQGNFLRRIHIHIYSKPQSVQIVLFLSTDMEMKFSRKLIIFFLVVLTSKVESVPKKSDSDLVKSFSNALNFIVKEFYLKNDMKFDFLIFGKKCEKFSFGIISNLMKSNRGINSIEIKLEQVRSNASIPLIRSTIVFIESFERYAEYHRRVSMENVDYVKFQHILVYKNKNRNNYPLHLIRPQEEKWLSRTYNYELGLYRTKQNPNQLILNGYTHSFETGEICGFEMKTLNIFTISNQTWENDKFAFDEIKSFNGCILIFNLIAADGKKVGWYNRILFDLFTKLQEELKFVLNKDSDSFHAELNDYRNENFDKNFIFKFFDQKWALVIALGDEYDSYEKFYLPFDNPIWMWCGIFFGGGFLVILIIKSMNRHEIEDFVFGHNVTSPAFNMLVAFFGQSQNILPTRSFARYILMLFTILNLILRTAYQGVQFEMMYQVFISILIEFFYQYQKCLILINNLGSSS